MSENTKTLPDLILSLLPKNEVQKLTIIAFLLTFKVLHEQHSPALLKKKKKSTAGVVYLIILHVIERINKNVSDLETEARS